MPNDLSRRFRERATDCRALAKGSRNQVDASLLEDIAAELEIAARRIDAFGVPVAFRAYETKAAANRN
jgi:hypothetical protein